MEHTNRPPVIKPTRLKAGDTIGIVSPAGPVKESELRQGLLILEAYGFQVHLAPNVFDREGYLAGDDNARLSDLHAMMLDHEIKAVFCTRGGYGSLRLLNMINYDIIREHPKILVGYSDITALLTAIHVKTGLVTFHGPMLRELDPARKINWESLFVLLNSDQPFKLNINQCTALTPGKARGPLIGGNLSLVCHLLGTPFMPSLDGCILFLEDRGEALYRLDRKLMHLVLSGRLKGISGLIAGRFEDCGEQNDIHRLFLALASRLGVPLITGFPLGHGQKNLALPLGPIAEFDTELMTLTITEACVT